MFKGWQLLQRCKSYQCLGVFRILENMGLKSPNGQYIKHLQLQEGPGSILSFQPQKRDRESFIPSLSQGTGWSGSPSPWHQPAHGEVGQKIQRTSAQARPDIPFQCKHCQGQAGGCAASSQRGSGPGTAWGPEQPAGGKATDLEVDIPSSP